MVNILPVRPPCQTLHKRRLIVTRVRHVTVSLCDTVTPSLPQSHCVNPTEALKRAEQSQRPAAEDSQHRTMSSLPSPFTAAHRAYVKNLYRRILQNELDWIVQRDLWRARALSIRAEFESNRCAFIVMLGESRVSYLVPDDLFYSHRDIHDPRALAEIFAKAEAGLASRKHPDPYRREYLYCGILSLALNRSLSSPRGSRGHQMVRPWLAAPNILHAHVLHRERNLPVCFFESLHFGARLSTHLFFTLLASRRTYLRTRAIQRGARPGRSLITHNVFVLTTMVLPPYMPLRSPGSWRIWSVDVLACNLLQKGG